MINRVEHADPQVKQQAEIPRYRARRCNGRLICCHPGPWWRNRFRGDPDGRRRAGSADSGATYAEGLSVADKISQHHDASGKVTTAVFRTQFPVAAPHFDDMDIHVDADMVVVGGGAIGAENPGALLTASYPNDFPRTAWRASSKDHNVPSPHRLTGFAIGMKIDGITRDELLGSLDFNLATGGPAAHPSATIDVRPDHTLIGGGFRVRWREANGPGNLATASFPEGNAWTAKSKDHFVASPCRIDVLSISLKTQLSVGTVLARRDSFRSTEQAHPSTTVRLAEGFALTGIGAVVAAKEPGSLLWKLEPVIEGSGVAAVGSKDHQASSPTTIDAWVIGIRLV